MSKSIFLLNGIIISAFGIFYTFAQTKAYGNHVVPTSTPEAICDLISMLVIITGCVLITIGHVLPPQKKG